MLAKFFDSPARIRAIREGPSGPTIEEFANHLYRTGYAKITARRHIRSAEHLAHWATARRLTIDELEGSVLKRFAAHLPRCRCGQFPRAARDEICTGARLFSDHLQGSERAASRAVDAETVTPEPELLTAFCHWMRDQRGSSDGTLSNYGRPIRELIRLHGEDPSKLTARCLRQFVMERSQRVGWAAANHCTTGLRMFLRFLIADGRKRVT